MCVIDSARILGSRETDADGEEGRDDIEDVSEKDDVTGVGSVSGIDSFVLVDSKADDIDESDKGAEGHDPDD